MDAAGWDERYRSSELLWGATPNQFVEQQLRATAPGRAVDLACGEGRNARWLALRGWTVTGVDFSAVAVEKARAMPPVAGLEWVCADVTTWRSPRPVDLALLCYLQLQAGQFRSALRNAAAALAPGGVLLVVGHSTRNLAEGVGGPQEPSVLFTPQDVIEHIAGTGLEVEVAREVLRQVKDADRPAIDTLVRARRPADPTVSPIGP